MFFKLQITNHVTLDSLVMQGWIVLAGVPTKKEAGRRGYIDDNE